MNVAYLIILIVFFIWFSYMGKKRKKEKEVRKILRKRRKILRKRRKISLYKKNNNCKDRIIEIINEIYKNMMKEIKINKKLKYCKEKITKKDILKIRNITYKIFKKIDFKNEKFYGYNPRSVACGIAFLASVDYEKRFPIKTTEFYFNTSNSTVRKWKKIIKENIKEKHPEYVKMIERKQEKYVLKTQSEAKIKKQERNERYEEMY